MSGEEIVPLFTSQCEVLSNGESEIGETAERDETIFIAESTADGSVDSENSAELEQNDDPSETWSTLCASESNFNDFPVVAQPIASIDDSINVFHTLLMDPKNFNEHNNTSHTFDVPFAQQEETVKGSERGKTANGKIEVLMENDFEENVERDGNTETSIRAESTADELINGSEVADTTCIVLSDNESNGPTQVDCYLRGQNVGNGNQNVEFINIAKTKPVDCDLEIGDSFDEPLIEIKDNAERLGSAMNSDRIAQMINNLVDNSMVADAMKRADKREIENINDSSPYAGNGNTAPPTTEYSGFVPLQSDAGRSTHHEHVMKLRKRTSVGKAQCSVQPEEHHGSKNVIPLRANNKAGKSSKVDRIDHLKNSLEAGQPYACRVRGCGKKYQQKRSLRHHEKVHNKRTRYECQECAKPFVRTDT